MGEIRVTFERHSLILLLSCLRTREKREFQILFMMMPFGTKKLILTNLRRQTINYELHTAKAWKSNWGFMQEAYMDQVLFALEFNHLFRILQK